MTIPKLSDGDWRVLCALWGAEDGLTLRQVVDALESLLEKQGLAALCGSSSGVPFLARPRRQEIFACFNRYRGLKL